MAAQTNRIEETAAKAKEQINKLEETEHQEPEQL